MLPELVKPDPQSYLPRELAVIGRLLTPEEKSRAMRGNTSLMVDTLIAWNRMQGDLRKKESRVILVGLRLGEIDELAELAEMERKLNLGLDSQKIEWYKRDDALKRWKLASEMADILIFTHAIMSFDGLSTEDIKDTFAGGCAHSEHAKIISEMQSRMKAIGMDMAEVIILKTGINIQHRPPALHPVVRANGYMKKMRASIGDESSQMPDLAQTTMGETVLTRLQAPKLLWPEPGDDFRIGREDNLDFAKLLQEQMRAGHFLVN